MEDLESFDHFFTPDVIENLKALYLVAIGVMSEDRLGVISGELCRSDGQERPFVGFIFGTNLIETSQEVIDAVFLLMEACNYPLEEIKLTKKLMSLYRESSKEVRFLSEL